MLTNFNMDFSKSVVIKENDREWVASSLAGVERQLLEREETESGRFQTSATQRRWHNHLCQTRADGQIRSGFCSRRYNG